MYYNDQNFRHLLISILSLIYPNFFGSNYELLLSCFINKSLIKQPKRVLYVAFIFFVYMHSCIWVNLYA